MKHHQSYNILNSKQDFPNKIKQGCFTLLLAGVILFGIYLLLPTRTNILLLGLDAREGEGFQARSDTMIIFTIVPLRPDVGILSIPRDLWISIPGYGEDRINAVHFFAEVEEAGTGPIATKRVVEQQFSIFSLHSSH